MQNKSNPPPPPSLLDLPFQVLREHGVDEAEVDRVFGAVDMDSSGRLHYMEFLAATIEARGYIEVCFLPSSCVVVVEVAIEDAHRREKILQ